MTETLSRTEYDEEVREQGERLAEWSAQDVATYHTTDGQGGHESYHGAVMENASDVLDAHEWFARTYYGPAFHGAIIEYADDDDVDPGLYSDWYALAESGNPTTAIERVAYALFESAVIEYALAQDPEDY